MLALAAGAGCCARSAAKEARMTARRVATRDLVARGRAAASVAMARGGERRARAGNSCQQSQKREAI